VEEESSVSLVRFWELVVEHVFMRIAKTLVVVVVVAVVAFAGLLTALTANGLAQTNGQVRIPGLHAAVTVVRDAAGIPQITADDPHDLFLAQGYVHAQERMWQMEMSRRIGAGRLSELFGKSQVATDTFIRTMGWRQAAQVDLDAASPTVRDLLDSYAAGVNAWIDQHRGRLSVPFVVTGLLSGTGGLEGIPLEPWSALDTATWQKVQSWALGDNMDAEIFRLLADARLGDPARTDQLFPAYPADAPVITATGLPGSGGAGSTSQPVVPPSTASAAVGATVAAAWARLGELGGGIATLAGFDSAQGLVGDHGVGSNDWVVSGTHTTTGMPVLANDPHLGYAMPSVWIMNGLHCRTVSVDCPWDVVGVSFPGAPAVILGHNARIAWGVTNVGPDVQDLFRETVDPADPTHYLYKGLSLPFTTRQETIAVAHGDPVTVTVRSTVHGPVLNDVESALAAEAPVTLEWTAINGPDLTLQAFIGVDVATDFASFRAALRDYGSPAQNFVYADVAGHIGYQLPGRLPIRGGTTTGDRVRDGASGTDDWTGYVDFDALPWQYDPPSGVIVTANNAPVDASYPYFLGDTWDPGDRAQRILDRIAAAGDAYSPEVARDIQGDTTVLRGSRVVAAIEALRPAPATADGRLLLDRIAAWDGTCPVASKGCAAFMTAELALTRALFDDELGDLARQYVGSPVSWLALLADLRDPSSPWWDDVATPARETAAGVVGAAIDAAAAQLRTQLGDPGRWTWGAIHTVEFKEGTLGSSGIGLLEWIFDTAPIPVAGAYGAVDNTYYRFSRAYADPSDPSSAGADLRGTFSVTNGPSYRFSIDLGALDDARIVITTGESGNPFDRHYGDMVALWARNESVPLPFSAAAISSAAAETLTLVP
jgi:penicillin amidase